ncbi:Histidine kinase-, DNA gyrase B-, and HSP90-like ATPase [Paenibacillus sp. yr247]|uniref:sensor histidine kinase n=1 Tax=Paenibacillus sp. yr247 TaxID=1761880 RepID=UPI000884A00C|nr:HAMP domain-containing sensor histidine kinase [Paenibacillus sp. yr247]SDP28670.1 Histidine kinase-, DNA gyrase B-, and HSP90-like ATPase [Paenibacillus sp. yr247]
MVFRLLIALACWFFAFFILRKNGGNVSSRWLSFSIFMLGLEPFAAAFERYVYDQPQPFNTINGGIHTAVLAMTYVYVFYTPYAAFTASMYMSDNLIPRRLRAFLAYGIALVTTPLSLTFQTFPKVDYDFRWIGPLGTLFMWGGTVILAISYLKEKNLVLRKNRERTLIVFGISILWMGFTEYLNVKRMVLGLDQRIHDSVLIDGFKYSDYINMVGSSFILFFLIYAIRTGMFGIKVQIERQNLDNTMMALTTGTAILGHTIKNEMEKLEYLGGRIKAQMHSDNRERLEELVDSIPGVTDHLRQMIARIQERTGNISLMESKLSLNGILASVISQFASVLESHRIQLIQEYGQDYTIICDPTHLQEVLNNLIMNAVDAMEPGRGVLQIRTYRSRQGVSIEIEDNGKGIPKEHFTKVFEPFFSTKNNASHYGLGLSYCYAVLRNHSGSLRIVQSEPKKGTTFALMLPSYRIVREEAV